ncbi:DUF2357 domain-containing protein [Azospirillum ramasamyi]|uniref:DUF2357 domain-containing protein n=1 Tax=Azospirillum ramasamyi TaxID=682998 RepID=A0A2U9SGZ3_9PROT|nr:DUF2357 domain-containing protein [Azospirillum ramasamyi]AWU98063.1 hypothetical protein DM194_27625 [Azospirillum ramasamyi]
METLYLSPAGGNGPYRVWPTPEPIPPGAVQEGGEHLIELRDADAADAAELYVEGVALRPLRCRDGRAARWAWSPGFSAGVAEAELRLRGRRISFSLETDPALRKLTRSDYDTMVGEVIGDTLALLAAGGHRRGFAAGTGGRVPPLVRLEYLRSRAHAVAEAVRAIDARPRRTLVAEETAEPYWKARTATGSEIVRSLASSRALRAADPAMLPAPLQGHLPEWIRRSTKRSSLDIPEHRDLLTSLRRWTGWLGATADLLAAEKSGDEEAGERRRGWAARLRVSARLLAELPGLPLFEGVREGTPRLGATPLFRHDPAYRRVFVLAREMELGIAPVFGGFLDLPLVRTYDIYELWVFLRLVRTVGEVLGTAPDVSALFRGSRDGIELATGSASVQIGSVAVAYQLPFREYWDAADGRGSMSREMIPDVVLASSRTGRVVALDAKYRVGRDLNAALDSAHMYRDALVATDAGGNRTPLLTGSYLVTPYAASPAGNWKETPMPDRLLHPDYRARHGFGAWTMRPGMSGADLRSTAGALVRLVEP